MVPKLPETDLLTHEPDIKGIDIWDKNFVLGQIPASFGCYAFVDARTKEVLYIGSATTDYDLNSSIGLRCRIAFYKRAILEPQKASATVRKIVLTGANRRLLLNVWICHTTGDAKKYEDDALRKHKPILNTHSKSAVTHEEHLARKRTYARNYMLRHTGRPYNPDAERQCTKCRKTKKCSEFPRSKFKKLGVKQVCKECNRLSWENMETKTCSVCGKAKKFYGDSCIKCRYKIPKKEAEKARKLGTECISEEDFVAMCK